MPVIAALFGGQGSQYPGMGKSLFDEFAAVRRLYEQAGDVFGFDVAKASFEGTPEQLAQTRTAQPVIFTHQLAAFSAAKELLPEVKAVAGHSLGEYAALCCAGAYSVEDGMRIVAARAAAMGAASGPGYAMVAITGLTADAVRAACEATDGDVWPVNFNNPKQTVISGAEAPCLAAAERLAAEGGRTTRLQVSGAFHTPLMQPAAEALKAALTGIAFAPTKIDFYSNTTGDKLPVDDYPAYFAGHMLGAVRFTDQIAAMVRDGVDHCVEFGPGRTAIGLAKKCERSLQTCNVDDMESLRKTAGALGAQ